MYTKHKVITNNGGTSDVVIVSDGFKNAQEYFSIVKNLMNNDRGNYQVLENYGTKIIS